MEDGRPRPSAMLTNRPHPRRCFPLWTFMSIVVYAFGFPRHESEPPAPRQTTLRPFEIAVQPTQLRYNPPQRHS